MRITQISVNGLFGLFDHEIPLNLEDRITIIHGPNGIGKTILLKMIDHFFNGQYSKLHEIVFDRFSISFDDESVIQISNDEQTLPSSTQRLKATFLKPSAREECILDVREPEGLPDIKSIGDNNETYSSSLTFGKSLWRPDPPAGLTERREAIPTRLIETQRLYLPTKGQAQTFDLTVEQCAHGLSEGIQTTLAESAEVSQSLERTFPSRLVQKAFSPLTENELRARLNQLEQEQSHLASVGLLTNGNELEFQSTLPIDEQNINALSIYVQDAQKKLGVFDKLAAKLALFKKIVEQKFLYKKLSISKEEGLVFHTPEGQVIPLSGLSSGEQHELVLLYELLFNTKPGSLILIDEPEISLHLAWQVNFLRDLQEISKLAQLDIILATHSPEIISDRWDLTVELKGPTQ